MVHLKSHAKRAVDIHTYVPKSYYLPLYLLPSKLQLWCYDTLSINSKSDIFRTLAATYHLYSRPGNKLKICSSFCYCKFVSRGTHLWSQSSDFASHLLQVLLGNLLLYLVFYLTMKLLHKERPRWYAWCFLVGAAAAWAPALYFFMYGSTNWSTTAAQSRARNHRCKLLEFYDSHDLWHLLSAIALYLTFCAMLTWDDGLAAVKRTDIAVF